MGKRPLKNHNKGFTLVELIVAVAILAVAASPLLFSFVSSARMDKKTRDIDTANVAAQNIQELVVAASAEDFMTPALYENVLNCSASVLELDNGNKQLHLSGVGDGNASYNAVVTFDTSAYDTMNSANVPSFSKIDAIYVQPSSAEDGDPDKLVSESFRDANGVLKDSDLKRTITLDITRSDDNKQAFATVTFSYSKSEQMFVYDLIPSGFDLTKGEPMNIYLMCFPWDGGLEYLNINNQSDVPANVFLVNQTREGSEGTEKTVAQLWVNQKQDDDFSKTAPTSKFYSNRKPDTYRVFTGLIFYYNGLKEYDGVSTFENSIYAHRNTPLLYAVDIALFDSQTATFSATTDGSGAAKNISAYDPSAGNPTLLPLYTIKTSRQG